MAGVKTSLALQDKVTKQLNRMITAADKMVNRYDKLDDVTNKVSNSGVGLWAKARAGMERAGKKLDEFKRKTQQSQNGTEKLAKAWGMVALKVGAAIAALKAGLGMVQKFLDEFNQRTKYEVQLSTVMGNQGNTAAQFAQVRDAADALERTTTYGADGLIGGAAELSTYLSDAKALEAMLPTLANYAAGMGGMEVTAEQMVNYATDLGKALDGTYDGLLKKGFILTDAQKEIIEFGTDLERVQVITDVINQSWDGLAEAFAATPEGKMQQFGHIMGSVAETIGSRVVGAVLLLIDTLTGFVQSEAGQWLVTGLSIGINVIVTALTWLVSIVQWLTAVIMENWAIIKPILISVALVLLALMISQLWAMVPPILTAAGGWLIMHWPILLVIAAIAAIIAIAIQMGMTFEDVCGFVGEMFGWLFAVGWNLVADAWNLIAVFAEFFGNVFSDPIGAIARLFIGLADFVLGVLETLAGAIDALFGSNLSAAVSGWRDSVQAWANENLGEQAFTVERMEKKDPASVMADWGNAGRNLGAGISAGLDSFTQGFDTSGLMGGGIGGLGGLDDAFGGDIGSVGNVGEVGKIRDEVDISKEDLELLRDISEARYVQNLVTLTPQVSLQVENVNENADIDRLVSQMEEKLEEEFVAAAEGVYKN